MEREIKFRGLRIDGKGWVYGFYRKNTFYNRLGDEPKEIYTKHFIGCFDNISCFDGMFEQVEVIPESVGQFTGLKNKNGIDVYEGDILKCDEEYILIKYLGCAFEGHFIKTNKLLIPIRNNNYYQWKKIGNIHSNPELL